MRYFFSGLAIYTGVLLLGLSYHDKLTEAYAELTNTSVQSSTQNNGQPSQSQSQPQGVRINPS